MTLMECTQILPTRPADSATLFFRPNVTQIGYMVVCRDKCGYRGMYGDIRRYMGHTGYTGYIGYTGYTEGYTGYMNGVLGVHHITLHKYLDT